MNIRWFSLLTVIIVLCGACAMPAAWAEDNGWYIGGGYDDADFDLSLSDFDDGSLTSGSVDTSDSGWKLFGGYRFNKLFSVEAGYVDLNNDFDNETTFNGVSNGTGPLFAAGLVNVDIQPTGFFVEGVGSVPIVAGLARFGKIGVLSWDADITIGDSGGVRDVNDDGTDLMYGVGFEYRFEVGLALRGEWERFTDVPDEDIDLVSAGISYTF